MHSIQQLLEAQGSQVWSVRPEDSVYRAIEILAERSAGALLVLDGKRLAGILSERDYARKVILQGRSSKETKVAEIMTEEVITTDLHRSLDQCLALMADHGIRHLPVVQDGELLGMLSMGDLVRAKIIDQQMQIENLERYIAGS